jgi:excisionase family DNA binding protein
MDMGNRQNTAASFAITTEHEGAPPREKSYAVLMPIPRDRLLVTPREAARMLSLSRSMIYGILERGELPSLKVGRARRIRITDLEAWMERKVQDGRSA